MASRISIIIPAYGCKHLVERLLAFLVSTITHSARRDQFGELILVNDQPADDSSREFLRHWARYSPFTVCLLESDKNEGFVRSVLRAASVADKLNHLLIATTDTVPYSGWLDSLVATTDFLEQESRAWGSLSPFSNYGGLSTIPDPLVEWNSYKGLCEPHILAQLCRHLYPEPRMIIELPYNQSFFLLLNRAALNSVGEFSESFSPGYGEDIDWCYRASIMGFRHYVVPKIYVHHDGRQSFGEGMRSFAQERLLQIFNTYPELSTQVARFIDDEARKDVYGLIAPFISLLTNLGMTQGASVSLTESKCATSIALKILHELLIIPFLTVPNEGESAA